MFGQLTDAGLLFVVFTLGVIIAWAVCSLSNENDNR